METMPLLEEWYDGTQRVLGNGMTLWAKSWPSAKTYGIVVGVQVGSFEDPPDRPGCAHCFEHIPFRGAGQFPSNLAIVDPVEEHGGKMNAGTGSDTTTYWVRTDPQTLEHALDVIAAFVSEPQYVGVEVERKTIVREYWMCRTDPPRRVSCDFPGLFYTDSRWGHAVIGTLESIETMAAEHLATFHGQWYSPGRMVAALVGPGETDGALLDMLEARFDRIKSRGDGPVRAVPAQIPAVRRGEQTAVWDLEETVLANESVFPEGWRNELTASLMCRMLGSGSSSPVVQCLREERGYFYTHVLGSSAHRGFGAMGFGCHVAPERAAACWTDFWSLVAPETGLNRRRWEWVRCQRLSKMTHAPFLPDIVAEGAVESLLTRGCVRTRNDYAAGLRSISHEEVLTFAHAYFRPEHCLQVTFQSA